MGWLQNKFEKNFMISTVDYVFNWARKSAVWPMTFGLACCAIEMIASSTARFDIARFGSEVFRPSPRQSDLMIVAGTVTLKMAPVVKRIYDQMPDPKWVISMGACSSVGGPFNTYAVLQGVEKILRTRRAACNVNVRWDDFVDTLQYGVGIERPTHRRAGSH